MALAEASFDPLILKALRKTAAFWGASLDSPEDLSTLPVLSKKALVARLRELPITPDHFYVQSTFNLNEPFSFVPIAPSVCWPALETTIEKIAPRAVLTLLPATLQMGPFFHNALHRTCTLGTAVKPTNFPLAVEIARQLSAELAVATVEVAQQILLEAPEFLRGSIRAWHIVATPETALTPLSHLPLAVRDLHALPGVSVASECVESVRAGRSMFHPSPEFVFEAQNGFVLATSIDERPAPLLRLPVARGKIESVRCACGSTRALMLYA